MKKDHIKKTFKALLFICDSQLFTMMAKLQSLYLALLTNNDAPDYKCYLQAQIEAKKQCSHSNAFKFKSYHFKVIYPALNQFFFSYSFRCSLKFQSRWMNRLP